MTYPNGMAHKCIAPVEIQEGDLVAFLDGEANSAVTRHIALCPACAAEVESLRVVEGLFSRALSSPVRTVSSLEGRRQKRRVQSGRFSPVWRPAALALTALLLMFGLGAGLIYKDDIWGLSTASGERLAEPEAAVGVETVVPPVVTEAVLAEAASPDVDQRFITRYQSDETLPSAHAIVESLAELSGGAAFPGIDRPAITRVMEVNIADRFLDEKEIEIAPPLNLRRMFEQQLQEQPDELLMRIERFKSKSIVAGQDGTQYVVWADNRSGVTTLYASRSSDGGLSWSEDVQIDTRVGRVFQPALAVGDQDHLYLIWRSWSNIHRSAFYFSYSTDGGQSWSSAIPIDTTPGRTVKPNLAVDADRGHLYVAWGSRRDMNTDIYFIHSTDQGQTWSSKVRMANIGS